MKIEIEVVRTYKETINLSVENILEIADNYKGDLKRWVEENYDDLMDLFSCDDEEVESIYYDKLELEELLKNSIYKREELLKNIRKNRLSYELQKHKIDKPSDFEEWEDITSLFDVETLKKVASYVAIKHPKDELKYIHIDGKIIEATDSKIAIRLKNQEDIKNEILFPVSFIELLEKQGSVYIEPNKGQGKRKISLKLGDDFYISESCFSYPDLTRIVDTATAKNYKTYKYDIEAFSKVMIDNHFEALKLSINEREYYMPRIVLDYFEISDITVHDENGSFPLFFSNNKVDIAVMPIVLDENSIVEEI